MCDNRKLSLKKKKKKKQTFEVVSSDSSVNKSKQQSTLLKQKELGADDWNGLDDHQTSPKDPETFQVIFFVDC